MPMPQPFEIPTPGLLTASYLAEVVDVQDSDDLGRVKVRLYNFDGISDQDGAIWARVAVPFAGSNRGAFFIPDVGDEVLVQFINGDSRQPVVVGGLWNGNARPPESLPSGSVDRWTIVSKAGTRIAIVEESAGRETISFTLANDGPTGTLTNQGGGKIELQAVGSTITISPEGVKIETPATVEVQASSVTVEAGEVTVNTGMATFSGVVQCNTLIATSVVSTSYTPGAGNIW